MLTPLGYDKMSCTAVRGLQDSATLDAAITAGATVAFIFVETQNLRFRDDGTDPTTANGILLQTTMLTPFIYDGDLRKIRFMGVAAGSVLHVSLYRQ